MRPLRTTSSVMGSIVSVTLISMSADPYVDAAVGGDARLIAVLEEHRGDAFLDDRRSGYAIAGEQGGAVVDRARNEAVAVEVDLALGNRRRGAAHAFLYLREAGLRPAADGRNAHVDDLHRQIGERMA